MEHIVVVFHAQEKLVVSEIETFSRGMAQLQVFEDQVSLIRFGLGKHGQAQL